MTEAALANRRPNTQTGIGAIRLGSCFRIIVTGRELRLPSDDDAVQKPNYLWGDPRGPTRLAVTPFDTYLIITINNSDDHFI